MWIAWHLMGKECLPLISRSITRCSMRITDKSLERDADEFCFLLTTIVAPSMWHLPSNAREAWKFRILCNSLYGFHYQSHLHCAIDVLHDDECGIIWTSSTFPDSNTELFTLHVLDIVREVACQDLIQYPFQHSAQNSSSSQCSWPTQFWL
jgi:hypothetical protein